VKPKAAIYLRLSRDDGTDSESNSIGNQRELLKRHARELGLDIYREFCDDGYTGTNFERPDFKEMIEAIEAKVVGAVLVKDLSRLGRNNALVSYYTEIFFPEHYIRFIAVNDGIDSEKGEDEIMPFRSVINEYYARDISKKVRSVKKNIAYKGEFQGSCPPYGYVREGRTIAINETLAPIVYGIFEKIANGQSMNSVAKGLRAAGIPTNDETRRRVAEPKCKWSVAALSYMLRNRAYMGDTVAQHHTRRSFKIKKLAHKPEAEWIAVPGTHKGIVSKELFDMVQYQLSKPQKGGRTRSVKSMFAGVLFCSDCGRHLVRKTTKRDYYYSCSGHDDQYYRGEDRPCSTHYIREDKLIDTVREDINRQIVGFRVNDYKRDVNAVRRLQRALENFEKREEELKLIVKRLIEKNAQGMIAGTTCEEMMREFLTER